MAIRDAKEEDLQAIAEVLAAAFQDEECKSHFRRRIYEQLLTYHAVFGGLKHPRRKEYPDDFIRYFYYKIGQHLYLSSRRILVATDDVSGKVVGIADWERQGKNINENVGMCGFNFASYSHKCARPMLTLWK